MHAGPSSPTLAERNERVRVRTPPPPAPIAKKIQGGWTSLQVRANLRAIYAFHKLY